GCRLDQSATGHSWRLRYCPTMRGIITPSSYRNDSPAPDQATFHFAQLTSAERFWGLLHRTIAMQVSPNSPTRRAVSCVKKFTRIWDFCDLVADDFPVINSKQFWGPTRVTFLGNRAHGATRIASKPHL